MKPVKIIFIAFSVVALTWFSYWLNFGFFLKYEISNSQEHWGQLGDFLGGILNPILTFLTILILIQSLSLQKNEIEKNKKYEKMKSFETHFFNMIESQKKLFDIFQLSFEKDGSISIERSGAAVAALEDEILNLKGLGFNQAQLSEEINETDKEDKIYSAVRTFCVIAKLIDKKLSNENGFTEFERKEYYEVLINYTDFSLVRLILLALKYTSSAQIDFLKHNLEFMDVLSKLGVLEYLDDM
ncbi:hypothetical protein [Cellvibrio sp. BR]|uniref:hypothetical protein n=1 Tax=Cellvibrio sp. BR TaxID=1134474 RepID=UPI00031C7F98|nr:hypothetical protein [Cellvibrio sp. BR]